MTDRLAALDAFLDANLETSLAELERLVAQPSVGAQHLGMAECAALVAERFRARAFEVEIAPTAGAPVVLATRRGRGARRLLFYNHYDVQPPEPLELWTTPPFTPSRRDGRLFGRGVSDDKGHLAARLFALDAVLAVTGNLPCSVTFVIEGEEETSSTHLHAFLHAHRERLRADGCVWEFGYVDARGRPLLHAGLRGICYVELSVATLTQDVHSGLGGSILPNAAWRLAWALASLKGVDERVRLPGFYDDVRPPTPRDLELMAALPDMADEYAAKFGTRSFLSGLTGGPALNVAQVFQPTCTICGLTSGYQGPGPKTVQPARASAKVDFRLVPNQRPETVRRQLREHLDAHGFEDVLIAPLGEEPPARTDPDHAFLGLVAATAAPVYGAPMTIVPMTGGSGPNAAFVEELGVPIATAGLGYPDSNVHAPNENIRLDLYLRHAKHMARLIDAFGTDG